MLAASPSLLDVSSFEKLVSAGRVDQKNCAPLTLECILDTFLETKTCLVLDLFMTWVRTLSFLHIFRRRFFLFFPFLGAIKNQLSCLYQTISRFLDVFELVPIPVWWCLAGFKVYFGWERPPHPSVGKPVRPLLCQGPEICWRAFRSQAIRRCGRSGMPRKTGD